MLGAANPVLAEVVLTNIHSLDSLHCENIIDAQDYLGHWHLSIVMDEKGPSHRQVHFLPFKSNRDEEFTQDDVNRVSPAFSRSEMVEPEEKLQGLKAYYTHK